MSVHELNFKLQILIRIAKLLTSKLKEIEGWIYSASLLFAAVNLILHLIIFIRSSINLKERIIIRAQAA
jgi:hypothetical protein